jgi:hypothetical protein
MRIHAAWLGLSRCRALGGCKGAGVSSKPVIFISCGHKDEPSGHPWARFIGSANFGPSLVPAASGTDEL